MTEPLDLAPIEARATAATRGPWERHPQYGPHFLANITGAYLEGVGDLNFGTGEQADADEEFVRHAQPDVIVLVAEVRRLRAVAPSAPADQAERREQYAVAIHNAVETDLSLVDQEPRVQALFACAAEAVMAVADTEHAAVLREAADALDNSDRLRDLTDDHMSDVNAAADELRRLADEAQQP